MQAILVLFFIKFLIFVFIVTYSYVINVFIYVIMMMMMMITSLITALFFNNISIFLCCILLKSVRDAPYSTSFHLDDAMQPLRVTYQTKGPTLN